MTVDMELELRAEWPIDGTRDRKCARGRVGEKERCWSSNVNRQQCSGEVKGYTYVLVRSVSGSLKASAEEASRSRDARSMSKAS